MSITIGWFSFDGPYDTLAEIKEIPGVFTILSQEEDRKFMMLDIGEGESVRSVIENHPNSKCWRENCWAKLHYAVFYTMNATRRERVKIATEIRLQYTMPCGKEIKTKPFEPPDIQDLE